MNNSNADLITESTAMALSFAQAASETLNAMTIQSFAFWGAAMGESQPARPLPGPPILSLVPTPTTAAAKPKTSTGRSWYRRPVESPAETMMKFWGALLPQQAISPWFAASSSNWTTPPNLQAGTMNPWAFWAAAFNGTQLPVQTPPLTSLFDFAASTAWLTQPSHNGWTKSPAQEVTDAWSWMTKSWMANPPGINKTR